MRNTMPFHYTRLIQPAGSRHNRHGGLQRHNNRYVDTIRQVIGRQAFVIDSSLLRQYVQTTARSVHFTIWRSATGFQNALQIRQFAHGHHLHRLLDHLLIDIKY